MTDASVNADAAASLRRDFADRDELVAYCREQFPEAAAVDGRVGETVGGRLEGLACLREAEPGVYAKTRNSLSGAVTGLSAYLHHGCLGLAETRDAVLERGPGKGVSKLVQELAWRDFFRRVLAERGDAVRDDLEAWKTGYEPEDYAADLPADILEADTGVDFVDAAVLELYETGYLHNQLRMKLAAYVVHERRVHWRAGADWFLSHLLDGDLGSNHLSWQWVASTFSHQPYVFNSAGLAAVSDGRFTGADRDGRNPFAGSNGDVASRWFDK